MAKRVDLRSLWHQPQSNWAVLVADRQLQVTVRAAAGNLDGVELLTFPRYSNRSPDYPAVAMERVLSDRVFDYFQATTPPLPDRRLGYLFRLRCGKSFYYLHEQGLTREKDFKRLDRHPYIFHAPYLHASEVATVPRWAQGALCYQIFPDRFCPQRKHEGAAKWGARPTRNSVFGGDIAGIISKLDHLESLRVGILYLTPIFLAKSSHKYDTMDYRQIDPTFGSKEDLCFLVEQCHRRGIRVVLDAVFNHCGAYFPPFQQVLTRGACASKSSWFHLNGRPIPPLPALLAMEREAHESGQPVPELPYETFAHTPSMPKLNTEDPQLREYLLETGVYWLRECGVDGWRLDVANEVDHRFWRDFRQRVKAENPEALIVGEVWHDASSWLQGDQFDAVMNYPFQTIAFDFVLERCIDAAEAQFRFNQLLCRHPPQVNRALWNMLDSHDTVRLLRRCDGDQGLVCLLLGFLFTYPGVPLLYYGTELGLDGGHDPDCRRCMPWQRRSWKKKILARVRQLVELRSRFEALRWGQLGWLECNGHHLLAFRRYLPDHPALLVLLNRGEESQQVASLASRTDLLTETLFDGMVPAKSMVVLKEEET